MSESLSLDSSPLADLQVRAAELRINKVKAEKEAVEVMGKELCPEDKAKIEKKRREILYKLEMEGAAIERDYVEKYRSKLAGLVLRNPSLGLRAEPTCHLFCQICITGCTSCVTDCSQCISPCPNCVTPCTNSVI